MKQSLDNPLKESQPTHWTVNSITKKYTLEKLHANNLTSQQSPPTLKKDV